MPLFHTITHLKLFRQPVLLAVVVCVTVAIWLGTLIQPLVFDQPLPAEKISAHRLRVNKSKLDAVLQQIETYQAPETPGNIPQNILVPPPK